MGSHPSPRKCACPHSALCCHNPSGDTSSVQTKCRWSLALGGLPLNPHLLGCLLESQGPLSLTPLPGVYVSKAESWLNRRWPDPDSEVGPSVQLRRLRGGSLAKATRMMRPQLDSGLPDPKAGLSPLLLNFVGWPVCPPLSPRRGLCIMLQSGCHLPPTHPPTHPPSTHLPLSHVRLCPHAHAPQAHPGSTVFLVTAHSHSLGVPACS